MTLTGLGTLFVMALVAFLIFRAEIAKAERAQQRSFHDTALGKDRDHGAWSADGAGLSHDTADGGGSD
ncbi:MAG: hypothetical protein R3D85_10940 [Paracoccaceae bacterium]